MSQANLQAEKKPSSLMGFWWGLFLCSLALRLFLTFFAKVPLTYPQELLSTELAQSIWKGQGFSVYSISLSSGGVLYPLLLAPFYIIRDPALRLSMMSLFSTAILCTALIPARLLVLRFLKDRIQRLAALLVFAASPALALSVTFLPDNLYLPLFLWTVYFAVRSLDNSETRSLYPALTGLFTAFLCLTDSAGFTIAIPLVFAFFISDVKAKNWNRFFRFLPALIVPIWGIRLLCFGPKGLPHMLSTVFSRSMTPMDSMFFVLSAVTLLLVFTWSVFYIPVAIPLAGYQSFRPEERRLFAVLGIAGIFTGFFSAWQLVTPDRVTSVSLVFSLRRFIPLIFPFFLFALSGTENLNKSSGSSRYSLAGWIAGTILFLLAVFLFLRRAVPGSDYDYPAFHAVLSLLFSSESSRLWILLGSAVIIAALLILRLLNLRKTLAMVLCALFIGTGIADTVSFLNAVIPVLNAPVADPVDEEQAKQLDQLLDGMTGRILIVTDDYHSVSLRLLNAYSDDRYSVVSWKDLAAAADSEDGKTMILTSGTSILPLPADLQDTASSGSCLFVSPDWVVSLIPNIRLSEQFEETESLSSVRVFKSTDPVRFAFYDPPDYTPGTPLGFAVWNSSFLNYPHYGFSNQESGFTWACETEAGLTLNPDRAADEDLIATISYEHTIGVQHLFVYANDILVYEGDIQSGGEDILFRVPASVFPTDGKVSFRFVMPYAASPGPQDPRALSIAFNTFTLSHEYDIDPLVLYGPPDYTPGTSLGFSVWDSSFLNYPHYGFSNQEPGFTWICEPEAGLTLKPDRESDESLIATVTYEHTIGVQQIFIYANDNLVYEGYVQGSGEDIVFPVPSEVFPADGRVTFRFVVPDALSPGPQDPRILSIAFSTFTLSYP